MSSQDGDRFQRLEALFHEFLRLPSDEREQRLQRVAEEDPDVHPELASMLEDATDALQHEAGIDELAREAQELVARADGGAEADRALRIQRHRRLTLPKALEKLLNSDPRTLITASELIEIRQAGQRTVTLDCRFSLADPGAGRIKFDEGHIPGARYAHLDDDLSGPVVPGRSGRHPLPDPRELGTRLGEWGIDGQTLVVCVDDVGGAFAARAWWLLRWLGHELVVVLDGGMQAWAAAGGTLETAEAEPTPRRFTARPRPEALATLDDVATKRWKRLIDSREAARYRGENEPIDRLAGHIPGAINRPFQNNLRDGHFKPIEELRADLEALMSDLEHPGQAVFYCGSGVTAAHNILAAALAGWGEARLYNGSWSEWIADGCREIATGDEATGS